MLSILQAYLLIRDEVMGKQIPPGVDVYARRLGVSEILVLGKKGTGPPPRSVTQY